MATDSTNPGQATDVVSLLLPLLLKSALTGKQTDSTELLNILLTGKPTTLRPDSVAQPQTTPRPPADITTLLIPLLCERITGKRFPGANDIQKTDQPQITSTARFVETERTAQCGRPWNYTILQSLGVLGTPFGVGAQPTQAGTLATLVPLLLSSVLRMGSAQYYTLPARFLQEFPTRRRSRRLEPIVGSADDSARGVSRS
ncbi:hypothetical protein GOC31_28565 [Sinorhizobium meliloti]|nr:hypothetical protein [Sinorhizobium meliloti]MDX0252583.1 hypothetical protein [Sinorhizobium meliloti]